MAISEDYLCLTLAEALALHDPKRARTGARVEQLEAALRALEARLAREAGVVAARTAGLANPAAA